MLEVIQASGEELPGRENGEAVFKRPNNVRRRLAFLLSDSYLAQRRGPVHYHFENPWRIPPSRSNTDWILTSTSKHCRAAYAEEAVAV